MNQPYLKKILIVSVFCFELLHLFGCAYRIGAPSRNLPDGFKQVAIPIFKNRTLEPGIEVPYTTALIQEFERSQVAKVVPSQESDAVIEGEISSLTYAAGGLREGFGSLPTGAVLASEYRILIKAKVSFRKISSNKILWEGEFNGERTYVAPQVTQAGLNSVNPLYNLSARMQNIDIMATEMMSEAHDRLTENF